VTTGFYENMGVRASGFPLKLLHCIRKDYSSNRRKQNIVLALWRFFFALYRQNQFFMLVRKYNILYLEDNPTDFGMVKAVLEEAGLVASIHHVRKKNDFVDALNSSEIDIILTDYSGRYLHSLEALSIAGKISPDIPVIVVTGALDDEIAVEVIRKGASDYVSKENVLKLAASVRTVMESKLIQAEKTRALEALREQEENYRALAENSPFGIVVHSEGQVIYHNKRALAIFKVDEGGSLIGKRLLDFVHPDFRQETIQRIRQLYNGYIDNPVAELVYVNSKGQEIVIEAAATPIRFNGKPAAQIIFQDISQRKQMELELIKAKEKAEESDRLKTAFLENLSHEIRTPLNGIIGFANLLRIKDNPEEERMSYIRIIDDSGKHLLSIIDDLIEISRIETGQFELNPSVFNLNEFLEEVFTFFNDSTKLTENTVILGLTKSAEDNACMVNADKSRLRQILYNLITNSRKFTREGRIDIGYTLEKSGGICFFVRDTGIGIQEKAKDIVFHRFRQADDSSTRKYGGTGLGLAICKGIVDAMKGKIWFESEYGKGTTFYVSLPLALSKGVKVSGQDESSFESVDLHGRRILIAEDDQSNFILLQHILLKTNAEVVRAADGLEVLELLDSDASVDLILLDIKMPKMDGMEVIQKIRSRGLTLPVIAQTAFAMQDDLTKCLLAGCNDYVVKPINAPELLGKVKRLLS
jgi:PAS domain S-box-containing protein